MKQRNLPMDRSPRNCRTVARGGGQDEEQPADVAEETVGHRSADPATRDDGGSTDILSGDTITILLDGRLALVNGGARRTNGGLGKVRFQGTADGNYNPYVVPVEADLVWTPRFTRSLSANVSAAWQRDPGKMRVDLIEAFINFLPQQSGSVGFQGARRG